MHGTVVMHATVLCYLLLVAGKWWWILDEHDQWRCAAIAGLDDLTFSITQGTQDIHDFSFEVQQEDVEVQPTQGTERPRSTKDLCKRTKYFDPKENLVVCSYFDPKENLVVCSAWLNVSKDPIHKANQSRSTSIMHRWLTILFQVNKYCSCYEAIERRNQSGLTIQEKKKKKVEADLIKEEKEIMPMDMSSLALLQKQYYETMQQKIIARRLTN
uniref:No apical meristem-associated C-terminal domain-containing protein n=1 Tax=Setaria viridis TaxID=4556 RepID=A0A4U6WAK3_SETVI|nr:hypothetical protein SEVIR_1G151900v2 [Setaria viridis]